MSSAATVILPPDPNLVRMIGLIFAALAVGSVIRYLSLRKAEKSLRTKRFASLRTWWIIALVVAGGLLADRAGICVLLAAAGIIAFREYAGLLGLRDTERPAIYAVYGIAVLHYLLILFGQFFASLVFVPLGGLGILAVLQLLRGNPTGYTRTIGGLFWGMIILIYGISHAAYLFVLPATSVGPAGPAGWFLFLVVLTEADDIFQAIVGRAFGAHKRHRITPVISPNKTWEGLLGGMLVTIGLAVLLAPWLTTLADGAGSAALPEPLRHWGGPALAGVAVTLAGFFGDINMSAVKRDSGVKDSSRMLPGMGGVIDRVDSLTFAAPSFVYFLMWWMD
ncbi:MAG: phosphatidate cytidylyltransferase [Gammaproteobacteria bacterium]|jgi:phosphatidate cytidylyltransferase